MLKVIVVDDEALILEKIVYLLKNSPIAFESIATAGNGREALAMMEQGNVPDIVLTDIRMPVIDGLELIERARAAYPGVRFIVISGYAEFDYAVKAMQFGVANYVLKPVKSQELISAVERVAEEVAADREATATVRDAESANRENKRLAFESRMREWLVGLRNNDDLRRELEAECNMFQFSTYAVSAIRLHSDASQAAKDAAIAECRRGLEEQQLAWWLLEQTVASPCTIIIFGGASERAVAQAALAATKRIYGRLQEAHGITASCAIGRIGDLRTAYGSCASAMKQRFLLDRGGLYRAEQPVSGGGTASVSSASFAFNARLAEQRLGARNRAGAQGAQEILLAFARETFVERIADYWSEASIDYLFSEYMNIVIRYCLQNNAGALDKIEQRIYSGAALDGLDDNHAIVKLLADLLDRLFANAEDGAADARGGAGHQSVIDQVVRYIDRNVHEELTLQTISEKFALNPSYLSRIFKAAVGQGFVKYVTERKIERAKQLLAEGTLDIAAIAHGLGFSDQQYFNRVYKKATGMTPSEWRLQRKKSPKSE